MHKQEFDSATATAYAAAKHILFCLLWIHHLDNFNISSNFCPFFETLTSRQLQHDTTIPALLSGLYHPKQQFCKMSVFLIIVKGQRNVTTISFLRHNRYMKHTLNILSTEPINIFGWPLFLPVCIARDYYSLWTENRMIQIISTAKEHNIAIEINDMAHTPHEKFIYMAKEQGLKFTFGSDSRNSNAGRLEYCKAIAKKCNLKEEDFYIPETFSNKWSVYEKKNIRINHTLVGIKY